MQISLLYGSASAHKIVAGLVINVDRIDAAGQSPVRRLLISDKAPSVTVDSACIRCWRSPLLLKRD